MLFRELSFVLLYVSAFGFSDYIVKTFGLTSFWYLLYYSVLFMVGVVGVLWMKARGEDGREDGMD